MQRRHVSALCARLWRTAETRAAAARIRRRGGGGATARGTSAADVPPGETLQGALPGDGDAAGGRPGGEGGRARHRDDAAGLAAGGSGLGGSRSWPLAVAAAFRRRRAMAPPRALDEVGRGHVEAVAEFGVGRSWMAMATVWVGRCLRPSRGSLRRHSLMALPRGGEGTPPFPSPSVGGGGGLFAKNILTGFVFIRNKNAFV